MTSMGNTFSKYHSFIKDLYLARYVCFSDTQGTWTEKGIL